jgi:hypothetical protein
LHKSENRTRFDFFRQYAKDNLEEQANELKGLFKKIYPFTFRVPVSEVDKSRRKRRNILAVVREVSK